MAILQSINPYPLPSYLTSSLWKTISTSEKEDHVTELPASSQTEMDSTNDNMQSQPTRFQLRQHLIQLLLSVRIALFHMAEAIALACASTHVPLPLGAADDNTVVAPCTSLVWPILLLSLFNTGVAPSFLRSSAGRSSKDGFIDRKMRTYTVILECLNVTWAQVWYAETLPRLHRPEALAHCRFHKSNKQTAHLENFRSFR
jgi:hypothetical protein